MSVLKLKPSCKDYLWGGHRLVEEYGKEYDGEILAETWELSCHPDGPSTIVNGAYAGKTLEEYIEAEGKEVLGTNCRRFRDFPILTKFIDAKQDLSIQVHPDNRYALKNEGQYGKTEMWYVVDAGKEAFLYYGFKKEVSKEEFAQCSTGTKRRCFVHRVGYDSCNRKGYSDCRDSAEFQCNLSGL